MLNRRTMLLAPLGMLAVGSGAAKTAVVPVDEVAFKQARILRAQHRPYYLKEKLWFFPIRAGGRETYPAETYFYLGQPKLLVALFDCGGVQMRKDRYTFVEEHILKLSEPSTRQLYAVFLGDHRADSPSMDEIMQVSCRVRELNAAA